MPAGPDVPRDPDAPGPPGAPASLRAVLLVLAGGVAGTALREVLTLLIPDADGIPVAILAINVGGAFLLGLLVTALATRGPDVGRRRDLRLLAGTGFCGGFTTYSALAAGVAALTSDGRVGAAAAYLLATLLLGGLASWAGTAAGTATAG